MAADHFMEWSTDQLSAAIRDGTLTCREVVLACLTRIERRNDRLNAFVKVFSERALARAEVLDSEIRRGEWRGPLHGLPVAIKDLVDIEGEVTGFGSRHYSTVPAKVNAPMIRSLEEAGAVIIGKTHTVEFAFGSWGTNYVLGTPRNPAFARHYVPGGSSSGSAVAVAAGLVPLAVGSDTGGSVRIPAALCGVAGMKPSSGAISLAGFAPLSPDLDTAGPLAKDAAGLKLLLDGIRGGRGETQAGSDHTFCRPSRAELKPADPKVMAVFERFLDHFESELGRIEQFRLPLPLAEYQRRCGAMMAFDAYYAHKSLIDDRHLSLDPWVRNRIVAGRKMSAGERALAGSQRASDISDFSAAFGKDSILLLPTTPLASQPIAAIDETQAPMSRFTRLANYCDLCAVTIPINSPDEVPVGVQLIMSHGQDDRLLSILSGGGALATVIVRSRRTRSET